MYPSLMKFPGAIAGVVIPSIITVSAIAQEDEPLPLVDPVEDFAAEAQPAPPSDVVPPAGTSQNVTVNLISRLVKRGVLTEEDAKDLLMLAEADAQMAQARDEAIRIAIEDSAAPPMDEGDIGVSYVPEPVKAQMRSEITAEVLAQARSEDWGSSRATPSWVQKYEFFGDIRTRYEGTFFSDDNDNTGVFPNTNAVNTGSPFNVAGNAFSPQYNVDQDRHRTRFRGRLGAGITMEEGFSAGIRLATGENASPVSTNQSFGASGGNFSKYNIWLDRGFLSYRFQEENAYDVELSLGRFENPFFSSDVMWDDDIGLDGLAGRAKFNVTDGVNGFITAGAFPIFNTDFNFSSNRPDKFESTDKWLYAAQIGVDWKINDDFTAKFAVAYHDFDGVEGERSTPFVPLTSQDAGDTDGTRPSFAQKGNTYIPLRDIIPDASNDFGNTNQFQYFGLATPFRNLTFTGKLDYDGYEPFRISLLGEFIKNIAYEKNSFALTDYGGDSALFLNLTAGTPSFDKFGDWMTFLGYRYVESDAVIDGFTDSDFGGGGTNVKGFTIGAHYALSPSVRIGARWLSSDEVDGPTLKSDVLQFDLNAKF